MGHGRRTELPRCCPAPLRPSIRLRRALRSRLLVRSSAAQPISSPSLRCSEESAFAVMLAMLQHSQQDYGPLPPELGPHSHCGQSCRGRRLFMDSQGNEQPVLREVQRDMKVYQFSPTPPLDEIGPFSPIQIELNTQTRRTCLASRSLRVLASRQVLGGWSK
ncbi:hypothetical protein C8Q70DRAFT_167718 [Cubamyces menziesii]|nr:hypothetical protein C8Q70DRAFT_167718 [Cubamyces menziesii]